jgi:hypothetical protein
MIDNDALKQAAAGSTMRPLDFALVRKSPLTEFSAATLGQIDENTLGTGGSTVALRAFSRVDG